MSTLAFPHAGHDHAAPTHHGVVVDFVANWFEATPAAILLAPVGSFLKSWFEATPVAIALRMMPR